MALRSLAVALVGFTSYGAYRIVTAQIQVTSDEIVVRNVVGTKVLPRGSVRMVVSANETPAQWLPYLRLDDGSRVKMFALARFKNRLWGLDRGSEELLMRLADELGVPLKASGNGPTFRWG